MKKFSKADIRSGLTVLKCFCIAGLIAGIIRLSSLLFLPTMTRFNTGRAKASFPYFLCYATRNIIGPFVGFFGKKFGLKAVTISGALFSSLTAAACFFAEDILTLTVVWGVLYGIGFGFGTLLLPEILSMHFSNHLDKAMGIYVAGDCVMSFLLSPLAEFWLTTYELSGTFLILSGLVLHSVPIAMLLHVPQRSIATTRKESVAFVHDVAKLSEQKNQEVSNHTVAAPFSNENEVNRKSTMNICKVFLDPIYIVLLLANNIVAYSYITFGTICIDFSMDHGASSGEAVYVSMGVLITNAIGCIFLGFVTDAGCLTKSNFYVTCFSIMGISFLACVFVRGFAALMVCAVILGLCIGGLMMISVGMVKQYVDENYVGIAIASRFWLYGPLSFTQAPLIGYFRDTLRSYDGLFFLLTGVCCMCAILSLLIPHIHRRREKKEETVNGSN